MRKSVDMSEYAVLPLREKISYCAGCIMMGMFYFLILSLCTFYYTDVMMMNATTVGTIVLISRVFDGVSDLIAGNIIDNTRSKYGKCCAWVIRFAIPFAAFMVLMYMMPAGLGTGGKIAYAFVTYNLTVTVGFTMVNTALMAMPAMLTRNQNERGTMMALMMAMSPISSAIGISTALPMVSYFGNDSRAWTITMAIFGVIGIVALIQCGLVCKERVKSDAPEKAEKGTQMTMIKAVATNGQWWLLTAIFGLYSVFLVGFSTLMTYFSTYFIGDTLFTSTINNVQSYVMAAISLLMIPLMRKVAKSKLILIGMIIVIPGQILMGVDVTNHTTLLAGTFIRSVGYGLLGTAMYGMVPDAIEYSHWRTGIRTDGMISSCSGFGNKVGLMIAGGIFPILLGMSGYDGALATQPESAMNMIKNLFIWSPAAVAVVVFVIVLCFYKIDKNWKRVTSDLAEGKFHPNAKYAPVNKAD